MIIIKTIVVIFNGGTISMVTDETINAAVPKLTADELINSVKGVNNLCKIENLTFSNLPSPHMTPDKMLELCKLIEKQLQRDEISGVVVTHGTDTMEETAFMANLFIDSQKPVVFTGAMKASSEPDCDGPFNLGASILTALSPESIGRGVLVCFGGEIFEACDVTKRNSLEVKAFSAPNDGPLGAVKDNRVLYFRSSIASKKIKIDEIKASVTLIKCVSGQDSKLVDFCLESGENGIVIEGLGCGNVAPVMSEGIKRAIEKNVPVVMVSRCYEGNLSISYGYTGGGKELHDAGVIFADGLTGQKARIKLLMALSLTDDRDQIERLYEK